VLPCICGEAANRPINAISRSKSQKTCSTGTRKVCGDLDSVVSCRRSYCLLRIIRRELLSANRLRFFSSVTKVPSQSGTPPYYQICFGTSPRKLSRIEAMASRNFQDPVIQDADYSDHEYDQEDALLTKSERSDRHAVAPKRRRFTRSWLTFGILQLLLLSFYTAVFFSLRKGDLVYCK